jgi:RNA polymerase sigma-70 factor (ECF subfamily)
VDLRLDEAVRRARHGDPRAFRTLTEHLAPGLIRFLAGLLGGDLHAAHDAAQETFVRAWDAMDTFESLEHLRRWCYRVGRCKAVSWLRRRYPRDRSVVSLDLPTNGKVAAGLASPAAGDEPLGSVADHVAAEEGDDRVQALRKALDQLPPRYRAPVQLHYLQGRSLAESARLLAVPRTTIKMRLHRARRHLRRTINQELTRAREARDRARRNG